MPNVRSPIAEQWHDRKGVLPKWAALNYPKPLAMQQVDTESAYADYWGQAEPGVTIRSLLTAKRLALPGIPPSVCAIWHVNREIPPFQ